MITGKNTAKNFILAAVLAPLAAAPLTFAAQSKEMTAKDLAGVVDMGTGRASFSLSPDRKYVAYAEYAPDIGNDTIRTVWVIAPLSGRGKPVRIDPKSEVILNYRQRSQPNGALPNLEARWSPDGEWIAYPVKTDGVIQLFRTRRDGSQTEQLTEGRKSLLSSDVNRTTFLWSDDGSKLYYQLGRDWAVTEAMLAREERRGFYFDPETPTRTGDPTLQRCGGTRHGTHSTPPFNCEIDYRVIEFDKGGKSRTLTEEEKTSYIQALEEKGVFGGYAFLEEGDRTRIAKGGNLTAWVQNADPAVYTGLNPRVRLAAAFDGEAPVICSHDPCEGTFYGTPTGFAIMGDEVVFHANEGHQNSTASIYGWSPRTNRLRNIVRTEDRFLGCQGAGKEYVCFSESWTTPRKLIAIDARTGKRRVIADANPQFRDFKTTKVEKIEFEDDFGNPAVGHLVYPKGYKRNQRYPLVIAQYRSRGFLRGGTGNEVPIHPLAAEGFFVLSFSRPEDTINDKARDSFEAETQQMEDFYEREMALTALHNVIDLLEKRRLIDPARIGVTGYSDGAETVGYALVNSGRFSVAATSGGFVHPVWYVSSGSAGKKRWERWFGNPLKDDSKWNRYAPGNRSERVAAPLLINVSSEELGGWRYSYNAMDMAGAPIEMHVFPEGYHTKWRPAQRYNIYRRNIQWMKFWLQGETTDDPVNPEQYDRWAKLCAKHVENLKASDNPKLRARGGRQRCVNASVD